VSKPGKRKIRKHQSVKRSCPTDRKGFWGEVEKAVQSEKKLSAWKIQKQLEQLVKQSTLFLLAQI